MIATPAYTQSPARSRSAHGGRSVALATATAASAPPENPTSRLPAMRSAHSQPELRHSARNCVATSTEANWPPMVTAIARRVPSCHSAKPAKSAKLPTIGR